MKPPLSPELPVYRARRGAPALLDGRPDKQLWVSCTPTARFLNWDASAPTQHTHARLCHDDARLYVLFRCLDDHIHATYTERDAHTWDEDVVELFVWPDPGKPLSFEIELSPKNVQCDCTNDWSSGSNAYWLGWNCGGLETAVTTGPGVWTAELAIPFASVGLGKPRPGDSVRLNLYRIDYDTLKTGRGDEYQCWSPTLGQGPLNNTPERFGTVVFE